MIIWSIYRVWTLILATNLCGFGCFFLAMIPLLILCLLSIVSCPRHGVKFEHDTVSFPPSLDHIYTLGTTTEIASRLDLKQPQPPRAGPRLALALNFLLPTFQLQLPADSILQYNAQYPPPPDIQTSTSPSRRLTP